MKWMNKGREFDSYWNEIRDIRSVYLFGAGLIGKSVKPLLQGRLELLGFIDNDENKQGRIIEGLPVFPFDQVTCRKHTAVLVAISPEITETVLNDLKEKNIAAYDIHIFLPVYFMYGWSKLVLTSLSYLPATVCNLRCKNCLNFAPYIKKQEVRDIEYLKADVDLLFSKVDYILLFHISGGEPFLYPQIADFLSYVGKRYRGQIARLEITTNGTIPPSDDVCRSLQRYGVEVVLDDYRDTLPEYQDIFVAICEKFKKHGVLYRTQKAENWIALNPAQPSKDLSEKEAQAHFNLCAVPWQEYRDGRFYLCNYSAYAAVAGLYRVRNDEWFSIENKFNKKELMEFRLGYSEKGYVDFCRQCDGYLNNPHRVIPAEQAEREV